MLVWQFHHTTTTILLSVVTVVEFASPWQMVYYTGSASHVVLSTRMSVSLRSSMHIKIDMAFLVGLRLVHPICFFSSFASSLSFHTCVLVCDPTRSVARALTLSKPGFFGAPKTRGGGGGHNVPPPKKYVLVVVSS